MKSSQVNIRLTEEMKFKLEVKAKSYGMSISEYIRYLIVKEIEKENNNERR